MQGSRKKLAGFIRDLRRRHVFQVAAAYVVCAWVAIEVASVVLPAFGAPDWALRFTIILFVIAFPIALILSWMFDLTPDGIVETERLEASDQAEGSAVKLRAQGLIEGAPAGISADGASEPAADDDYGDEPGDEYEDDSSDDSFEDSDAAPETPAPFAERRSITVLRYSIDLADEGNSDSDPEALLEHLPELTQRCEAVIQKYGGHLAWDKQSEAEVYFGYPVALEHDARSAVRCALSLVHDITAESQLEGTEVDIRAGVCSGVTVIEPAKAGHDGDAPPVTGRVLRGAARLLDVAPRGKVVISESTKVLIGDMFESVRANDGTDVADADRTWFVAREQAALFNVTQRPPIAALLGRDSEIALLEDMWQRTTQEIGQSMAIVGDPGYGKSALVSHIVNKVAAEDGSAIAVCQCAYLNRDVALHPIADLYRRSIINIDRAESRSERVELIEDFLEERGLDVDRFVPIVADLLHISAAPKYPPLELEPQEIKDQTLEFVIDSLFHRAADHPVLLVIEDLHWSDATTRELLGRIIRRGPETRLFTLLTFRPEFDAPWSGTSAVTQVTLRGLSKQQARAFVRTVSGDAALPDALVNRIVEQSDGVPLFLEELTKAVIDSTGASGGDTVDQLPATLQETLTARLDRLGIAKRVAQMAAVFGRDFEYPWITAVSGLEPEALDAALAELVASELLYQKGVPPKASYFFKHVLLQEAAYESLLKRDRKEIHRQAASLFETQFQEWRQSHPQIVATHWAAAGEPVKAASLYLEAGNHALGRSAYDEAEKQCRAALRQVELATTSAASKNLELGVCVALGQAMTPTRGFFSKEVEEVYERARTLSVELGEAESNFRITSGLWRAKIAQGRLLEAQQHAEETRAIAVAGESDVPLIGSSVFLGITDFHLGNFESAEQHLASVIELYGTEPRTGLAEVFGQDPGVTALGWFSISRWLRGNSTDSHRAMDEALRLSRGLDHPFTHAYTLRQSLLLRYFRRELDPMSDIVDELDELSETNGFAEMHLYVSFWRNVLAARESGRGANLDGIAAIVVQCEKTGIVLNLPYIRGILAELYLDSEKYDACAAELLAAIAEADQLSIQWIAAELHRLQGRLLTERGASFLDEAKRSFDLALEVSGGQDNVFFGLRARLDLARMYFRGTQKDEAAGILTEIDDLGIDPGNLSELSEKNRLEKQLSA